MIDTEFLKRTTNSEMIAEKLTRLLYNILPRFFNPRSKIISYSIPIKCFARSDAGPHRGSESTAFFTSRASLVVVIISISFIGNDEDFTIL